MKFNNILKFIYMSLFIILPVISNKTTTIFGVIIPASTVFSIILMLGIVDLINYRMGIKEARQMILESLIVKLFIFVVIVPIAIHLPSAPFWHDQDVYVKFLQQSIKMFIATEIVTFIGQYLFDTQIFHMFRKMNWFTRVMLSDIVSLSIQTSGIMVINYWGVNQAPMIKIVVSAFLLKLVMSVIKAIILYPLAGRKHRGN
jgi:uncharacterized PurR-regulated membrane protein YhhQ (DUF165 family)